MKTRSKKMNGCVSPRTASITVAVLRQFTGTVFVEETRDTTKTNYIPCDLHDIINAVICPVIKETITKYQYSFADPITQQLWSKTLCNELVCLTQRYSEISSTYHTKGTNIMQFLELE